jgi:aminoglycoside phosphotransferase (APT) family kinase protein
VNAIFRIGESMVARFPLHAADPGETRRWLLRESDAAREFARRSAVPSPEPVALGEPGDGYPLPWSIQTWVPGRDAVALDPSVGGN